MHCGQVEETRRECLRSSPWLSASPEPSLCLVCSLKQILLLQPTWPASLSSSSQLLVIPAFSFLHRHCTHVHVTHTHTHLKLNWRARRTDIMYKQNVTYLQFWSKFGREKFSICQHLNNVASYRKGRTQASQCAQVDLGSVSPLFELEGKSFLWARVREDQSFILHLVFALGSWS